MSSSCPNKFGLGHVQFKHNTLGTCKHHIDPAYKHSCVLLTEFNLIYFIDSRVDFSVFIPHFPHIGFILANAILLYSLVGFGWLSKAYLSYLLVFFREIFPYLVVVIGLENVLVLTKSVVSTPVDLEVKLRIAQGQAWCNTLLCYNMYPKLFVSDLFIFFLLPRFQKRK